MINRSTITKIDKGNKLATFQAKTVFAYKHGKNNSANSNCTRIYSVQGQTESAVMAAIKKESWYVQGQTDVVIKKLDWV